MGVEGGGGVRRCGVALGREVELWEVSRTPELFTHTFHAFRAVRVLSRL